MRFLLLLIFPILTFPVFGQDSYLLLKKSKEKCALIKNGTYRVKAAFKYLMDTDTTFSVHGARFEIHQNDSLFGSYFRAYESINSDRLHYDYTGDRFLTYAGDSGMVKVYEVPEYAAEVKSIAHNYALYNPFTNYDKSVLKMIRKKEGVRSTFLGMEVIQGTNCYHIRIIENINDSSILSSESELWINKDNFLPLKYSAAITLLLNQDTLHQYESAEVVDYQLNDAEFTLKQTDSLLTGTYTYQKYTTAPVNPLLPINTTAPDWSLTAMDGTVFSSMDLKGKVVVLDFFFRSCHPCLLTLPVLEKIDAAYKNRELVILGIDNVDKDDDVFRQFLLSKNIRYPVTLGNDSLVSSFKVSEYPTLYIIDKKGVIHHIQVGYAENLEEELTKLIESLLD